MVQLWKKISSKTLLTNRGKEFITDKVITPKNEKSTYAYTFVARGVVVIPIDKQGNVYLQKEYRYPINSWNIEAIGGGIKKGQTARQAAKEELLEEGGIKAKKLTKLGTTLVMPSHFDTKTTGFLATNLTFHNTHHEADELIKPLKMPLKKAIKLAMDGKIENAETVTFLLRAANKLNKI